MQACGDNRPPVMLRVEISAEAGRFLQGLPARYAIQIDGRIRRLAVDPFPAVTQKLRGTADVYRVRQGAYRILYRVLRPAGLLRIEAIGDRKDIYR